MHNIFKALSLFSCSLVAFACSDWTDAEAVQMTKYSNTEIAKKETYYQALRDWKATKHSISFGCLEVGAIQALLQPICWQVFPILWMLFHSGTTPLTCRKDKRKISSSLQKVREQKVLFCSFTSYVGQHATPKEHDIDEATRNKFWGWEDGDTKKARRGCSKICQCHCRHAQQI